MAAFSEKFKGRCQRYGCRVERLEGKNPNPQIET